MHALVLWIREINELVLLEACHDLLSMVKRADNVLWMIFPGLVSFSEYI
jgi:hypothetical protein